MVTWANFSSTRRSSSGSGSGLIFLGLWDWHVRCGLINEVEEGQTYGSRMHVPQRSCWHLPHTFSPLGNMVEQDSQVQRMRRLGLRQTRSCGSNGGSTSPG